ncbi:MAG: potassium transporter Kup [Alphaproteobacteria bacterium]|nr:potassium transporter Kup [Alphaproteobacteria bacterium]
MATTHIATSDSHADTTKQIMPLIIGAVGVVFGDIGTSPLYTIRECLRGGSHELPITPDNILGVLSMIFWSVTVVVSLKYALFIMRADNQGQGGILALMALALNKVQSPRDRRILLMLGIAGAALFYGDGMITPAISVLSAVEGLKVATPVFDAYVVPITIAIVITLFLFQSHGTAKVGALFGPITLVWFAVLALLGVMHIVKVPAVLLALNPLYAVKFVLINKMLAFLVLGAVVLAFTGAEALYTDMGHFGRRPIRMAWFALVFPALMLNYFGQGALLLTNPAAIENPFYLMAPSWALYPMVALATLATIIASQAVISGAFSISRQAVQLGLCPRMEVRHTSEAEIGQIYIPQINWGLMVCIVLLILMFQSSSNLASAYGIAVTGCLMIDTIQAFVVVQVVWGWSLPRALVLCGALFAVDTVFFSSNLLKVVDGGWFPLLVGAVVFVLLSTWYKGRNILRSQMREDSIPVEKFVSRVNDKYPMRVPGTAVFLTSDLINIPFTLLHNLKHNKVLHERTVFLSVATEDRPFVNDKERVMLEELGKGFYRLQVRYGFKESPNVPRALSECAKLDLKFDLMDTSFFLGHEKLVPGLHSKMARWRDKLFIWMSRNALAATEFFRIPSNRVVEVGTQVEL